MNDRPTGPFVARSAELATLHCALAAADQGTGAVIFVTGDVGSGKTALVQGFIQQALQFPGARRCAEKL